MCMNCGCGQPGNDQGKPANITAEDLQRAADVNGQSLRESARHIVEAVELLAGQDRDDRGLAKPAGPAGAAGDGHGTPSSES
jgi:hypothetical protein